MTPRSGHRENRSAREKPTRPASEVSRTGYSARAKEKQGGTAGFSTQNVNGLGTEELTPQGCWAPTLADRSRRDGC